MTTLELLKRAEKDFDTFEALLSEIEAHAGTADHDNPAECYKQRTADIIQEIKIKNHTIENTQEAFNYERERHQAEAKRLSDAAIQAGIEKDQYMRENRILHERINNMILNLEAERAEMRRNK